MLSLILRAASWPACGGIGMPSWRVGLTMGFDPLAPHYRWMEFVLAGNKLQRCRTAFLSRANQARNILLMGEGNGRFLIECRRRLKQARITCVDNSGCMLESARERLVRCGLSSERPWILSPGTALQRMGPAPFGLLAGRSAGQEARCPLPCAGESSFARSASH